VFHLVCYWCEC